MLGKILRGRPRKIMLDRIMVEGDRKLKEEAQQRERSGDVRHLNVPRRQGTRRRRRRRRTTTTTTTTTNTELTLISMTQFFHCVLAKETLQEKKRPVLKQGNHIPQILYFKVSKY